MDSLPAAVLNVDRPAASAAGTAVVRALVLTDVVDSTRLAETMDDAALAALWAAHDQAAREPLPGLGGLEIDKTDGMLLMFERVQDALAYAAAYHAALAALPLPLQARAGVHVGAVVLRHNPAAMVARGAKPIELDGIAKPTVARLMTLAHGGQTLLSRDAVDALAVADLGHVLGAARPHAHGHWHIKGVSEPIEVFETGPGPHRLPLDNAKCWRVARAGTRWLPVSEAPHNLPPQANSFVGRDAEIDALKDALAQARLVTVLGMGGLGKTRLALQAAAELRPEYPGGAWLLDLSPLRDPALVVAEAARLFDARAGGSETTLQALCATLRAVTALLVVDNCEHLPDAVAALLQPLLAAAPGLRVVATSRSALRLPGERLLAIHPLPLPAPEDDAAAVAAAPAVRLFVERAQAQRADFVCDAAAAPALASLAARLEGIPLAIELAAARVRTMSVAELDARLDDRYRLLSGNRRGVQQRQQTLRALVDWSHELLADDERTLLRRLAVFRGGFDLEAAEAVAGAPPLDPLDIMDRLDVLVDQSLLTADTAVSPTRFRMLETLREYAGERLEAAGEAAEVRQRHAAHCWALARQGRDGLRGPQQPQWSVRLEMELDNLRGAIAAALAGVAEPVLAAKMTVALQQFWIMRGRLEEGRALTDAALALPAVQDSPMARAHLHYVAGALAESQGDAPAAERELQRSLALRRAAGDAEGEAHTLSTLSLVARGQGREDDAEAFARQALALSAASGHRMGEAVAQLHLAWVALHRGAVADVRAHVAPAQRTGEALGHREVEGECELLLALADEQAGLGEPAQARLQRSLRLCREAGDRAGEARALQWLGHAALDAGDVEGARLQLAQALQAFRRCGMKAETAAALQSHAQLAHAFGDDDAAAALLAAADVAWHALGRVAPPYLQRAARRLQQALADAMGADASRRAHEHGATWAIAHAVDAALTLAPQAVN